MLSAGHVACCRPKKARQLARNCSDGYRLRLAPPEQRSVATVETALRLPGDLAYFWRRGCDLGLFGNAHPGRRARRLPALVMGPRLMVSPVELSEHPHPT